MPEQKASSVEKKGLPAVRDWRTDVKMAPKEVNANQRVNQRA